MTNKTQNLKLKSKKSVKKTSEKRKKQTLPLKSTRKNQAGKIVPKYRKKPSIYSKMRSGLKIKTEAFITFIGSPLTKRIALFLFILLILSSTSFYFFILKDLPSPEILITTPSPQTTIIRDRNGTILYKVYKNANRIKLPWEEIPQSIKDATIAIEDANFYHHFGISPKAIIRAFLNNLQEDNINLYQGGSTITQQLVKNKLVGPKKTYVRKIKEIVLSLWTERIYSKNDILNMYLNEVGYGGPAYGIAAASEMYFGKPASRLTLAEASFLTGLPAAPTTFSPFGNRPELATIRQREVLERMEKLGMITKEQKAVALVEKLVFAPQRIDIKAPHFVMYVRDQLVQKFGEDQVTQGGLDVVTTLDLNIQNMAEEVVKKQIAEIRDIYNIHNGSVLVTNPQSGEVLAMVGSVNYFDIENKGYVNVATSLRQPGSAIKPVNYAYAFDHGYTPGSTIEDSPVVYTAKGATETYIPQNYDGKFHGVVTLRNALANSYNVPAVKLLNTYGVEKMIDLGMKMGIKSWNPDLPIGLSLTLGGAEVTMLDLSRVYGTIANLGIKRELKVIKEVKDNHDQDITSLYYREPKDTSIVGEAQASENTQVISPLSAYWLTDILSDNIARLPAFGPYAKLTIPGYKVAVKTGTSNNFRDNWTIGFTPDLLVEVWVGNNDGTFMNKNLVSGITGAAPIWNEIMSQFLKNTPPKEFKVPEGLIPVKICAVNGLLTCPNCPQEKTEYFTANKVPTQKCFFRPSAECDDARKQAEGKSEEEKKQLLSGCLNITPPAAP